MTIDYCPDYDLSLKELEMCLDVSAATLRQQIASGALKAYKVGPMWMVAPGERERYRSNSLGKPGRKRRVAVLTDR